MHFYALDKLRVNLCFHRFTFFIVIKFQIPYHKMSVALSIQIQYHQYFNYTFCLNQLNFLQEIRLLNEENNLDHLNLEIKSSLGIFKPLSLKIDVLKQGLEWKWKQFDFEYDLNFIKKINEKDWDSIAVTVFQDDKIIGAKHFNIEVLPLDHFGGFQSYPQLLAAYVTSNHPKIYEIKAAAIKILESNNLKPAFEGYQENDKERVVQMCNAIYKAIQNLDLIYSTLPPSFETEGQRIRLLDQVMNSKFGNCIDITLLFAACLEAISLHPIIIVTKGHAFVGVWLHEQRFDEAINYDQAAISKRIAQGIKDIAIVESTMLCKGSSVPFNVAVQQAESQLMASENFVLSLDIKSARAMGVKPIPRAISGAENINEETNLDPEFAIDEAYDLGALYQDLELSDEQNLTKQKIWERKLLDLSLRNNLLNLRFTKSMLQLADINLNQLEDSLCEGKSFSILAHASQVVLKKYNLYADPLHQSDAMFQLAQDEFKYGRLLTHYHKDDLDTILTHLFRNAKLSEEENGKSTLYLGLGMLKWFEPKNKSQSRLAPILLVPVELSRRSVNSKFTLKSREEDTMINITLLEYLRQEYKLNLNNLENLPTDELGVDVGKVFAILRHAIMNLPGWDILEQVVLGNFSFNKLILWQDISKYADELQKSNIVKSLIDGKLSSALEEVLIDHKELEFLPAKDLTLPIPTDNSQLNAVKSAHQNKSFILHGPPGTGKSQTITNIIADALANQKKVLFVASKKAALDVVHDRLERIGLGPFCLELHSNKSKKSDVLLQFERSLNVPQYQVQDDAISFATRLDENKLGLRNYVNALHHKFPSGWTLFDSLSFLQNHNIVPNDALMVPIDIEHTDATMWHLWQDFMQSFAAIMLKTGQPNAHPLRFVSIAKHRFENKKLISKSIESFIAAEQNATSLKDFYALESCSNNEIITLLKAIGNSAIMPELIDTVYNPAQFNLIKNWSRLQNNLQDIQQNISSLFNSGIYLINYAPLQGTWNKAKHSWFLSKWWYQRKVKSQLNPFAKNRIDDAETVEATFANLEQFNNLKNQLSNAQYISLYAITGLYLDGETYRIEALRKDLNALEQVK